MSWHKRHRKDDTQDAIVAALRDMGIRVWPIGRPCDLLVQRAGQNFLLDCDGVSRYRVRSDEQLRIFAEWGVVLVKTPEEALKAVGL